MSRLGHLRLNNGVLRSRSHGPLGVVDMSRDLVAWIECWVPGDVLISLFSSFDADSATTTKENCSQRSKHNS